MLLWLQYQFNTSGGAVAVGAVRVCCCGCSTMIMLGRCSGYCRRGMLLWVQYHVNTNGGAVAVGSMWACFSWVQDHVNTSGGFVAVGAVWLCCFGRSTMLILVVAL